MYPVDSVELDTDDVDSLHKGVQIPMNTAIANMPIPAIAIVADDPNCSTRKPKPRAPIGPAPINEKEKNPITLPR